MKFFTYVILPEETSPTDNKAIEKWVDIALSQHLEGFKGDWSNRGWDGFDYWGGPGKLDYYRILFKENNYGYEFEENEKNLDLYYDVVPVEKVTGDLIPFAILTPRGLWRNDSYPLQEDNPNWPNEASSLLRFFHGFNGVYLYCHC